jgi:hypothetical protein
MRTIFSSSDAYALPSSSTKLVVEPVLLSSWSSSVSWSRTLLVTTLDGRPVPPHTIPLLALVGRRRRMLRAILLAAQIALLRCAADAAPSGTVGGSSLRVPPLSTTLPADDSFVLAGGAADDCTRASGGASRRSFAAVRNASLQLWNVLSPTSAVECRRRVGGGGGGGIATRLAACVESLLLLQAMDRCCREGSRTRGRGGGGGGGDDDAVASFDRGDRVPSAFARVRNCMGNGEESDSREVIRELSRIDFDSRS